MPDNTRTTPLFSKKELKFKKRLDDILQAKDLTAQKDLLNRIASISELNYLDYAAALIFLSQPNLYKSPNLTKTETVVVAPKLKMIRYRLDIGQKHHTSEDEIKSVFVSEAGVDKNLIGHVDMRHHYTLIDLPDGMPTDIFQLLNTINIQQRPLKLKRLKNRRFQSKNFS